MRLGGWQQKATARFGPEADFQFVLSTVSRATDLWMGGKLGSGRSRLKFPHDPWIRAFIYTSVLGALAFPSDLISNYASRTRTDDRCTFILGNHVGLANRITCQLRPVQSNQAGSLAASVQRIEILVITTSKKPRLYHRQPGMEKNEAYEFPRNVPKKTCPTCTSMRGVAE
jgi:hypothetical protein